MRVVVVGSGYVGLISGACFADLGHNVTCVDANSEKIEALSRGKIPIYEPGLQRLISQNVRERRLGFSVHLGLGRATRYSWLWALHQVAAMAMPICPTCMPPPAI